MKHYIYRIQNINNNKVYIGYSINPVNRWAAEKSAAFNKNDCEYFSPLSSAIRKYGWNSFSKEIIADFENKEEALESEKFWILHYKSNIKVYGKDFGYNLHEGGNVPPIVPNSGRFKKGVSASPTTQFKKGNIITDELKKLLSEVHTGRKDSNFTKKKKSESKLGDKNPGKIYKGKSWKLVDGKRVWIL